MYKKDYSPVMSLRQNGVEDVFTNIIKSVYENNVIGEINFIPKKFSKSNYKGESTYLVNIDDNEREFLLRWKFNSDASSSISMIIYEIVDNKRILIFSDDN